MIIRLHLLFFLLHTAPAKQALASLISSLVSRATHSELTIGELDYRLWEGDIRAGEVTFVSEDAEANLTISVPEIDPRVKLSVHLLDETISQLPASVPSLVDDEAGLGHLAVELPHQLGLAVHGGVDDVDIADLPI